MKHKMKNVFASFILMASLWISLVPVTVYAAPDTEEDGTEQEETVVYPEDAVYLSTADDLSALAENCMDDDWSIGKTVVLQNDIDLTGMDFYGIPSFGGTFYGEGHTISGWSVKYERSVVGFFRYTQSKAVIDRLYIEGTIQPEGTSTVIGSIAGVNGGTICNCSFTGTLSGNEIVGGIAGLNKSSSIIENCTVSGKVYGDHYVGGIVGENNGVVRQCTNQAEVNAEVDHNSLGMSLEMDISSLTEKESTETATNIGGIAGTSTGVIRECVNQADVGYKKMGYNVGGIAGSQNGYIVDSANHGKVEGYDGVGGIVGQFKPNIVLEFGPDPIETMQNKMNSMMNSMKDSMQEMTSSMKEFELSLGDGSFDMNTELNNMKEALGSLEDWRNPETGEFDPDMLDSLMNDFSDSFDKIYEESQEITNITDSLNISSKMEGMMSEMESMMSSMGSMNMSTEINIQDISRYDKKTDTVGKVAGCINYGGVFGENGIAGIAGNCDSEMMMSEEDMDTVGEESMSISGSIRLVIRDCKNFGTISANKDYVGGIAGQMVQGAIMDSCNIGNLDCLNADYVGGIAGNCDTYISECFSKCILAGADYVGGIAGCGMEVQDSYAFVDIAAGTEYVGSIIGGMKEMPEANISVVSDNYYYHVGTDRGGIDGINYKGATGRISLDDYLLLENLDEMFKTVTVTFTADNQEDIVKTLQVGESMSLGELPVLSVEDGEMYDWVFIKPVTSETLAMDETEEILYISENRLTNIMFDQMYEAEFEAKHMVIPGEDKTAENRSIVLAVGAFDKNTSIELIDKKSEESIINEVAVKENWQVAISNIGVEKLHYHVPDDIKAENIQLFVKDASGVWAEREYMIEGSYIVFAFADGEMGFALAESASTDGLHVGVVVAAVLILILIIVIVSKKRKQKVVKKGNKE